MSLDFDGPINVLYFEPQTGIIRNHDWESNFYHYRIRQSRHHDLEAIVEAALPGPGGLEYGAGALAEIAKMERECDEATRRLLSIAPERAGDVPRRQDGLLFEGAVEFEE